MARANGRSNTLPLLIPLYPPTGMGLGRCKSARCHPGESVGGL